MQLQVSSKMTKLDVNESKFAAKMQTKYIAINQCCRLEQIIEEK